jgi:hypothetical protein
LHDGVIPKIAKYAISPERGFDGMRSSLGALHEILAGAQIAV